MAQYPDSINPTDLADKLGNMPEGVKNFLISDFFSEKLARLKTEYDLLDELGEGMKLEQLILLFATGIIEEGALSYQIGRALYINSERSEALAKNLIQILGPVIKSASATSIPEADQTAQIVKPAPVKPFAVPPFVPQKQKPAPDIHTPPGPAEEETDPPPFIMHDNAAPVSNIKIQPRASGLMRPIFSEPRNASEPRKFAEIDAADSEVTSNTRVKVVNYSAPKMKPAEMPRNEALKNPPNTPPSPQTQVNPDNIVDLKDLPR